MAQHNNVHTRGTRFLILGLAAAGGLAAASPARGANAPQPEPPITVKGAEGDYLRLLHRDIHFRWASQFIEDVAEKRPPSDPLNNLKLEAEVLFTVRWDGSPAEVTLSQGSGNAVFDRAAVTAAKGDRPYPVPPIDVYADDGVAHFRWIFARDYRLCSQGEVRRVEAPLAEALPRLFYQGRMKEALLRVARYTREGDKDAMSIFARAWLSRPWPDPGLQVRAAAALAHAGDARQIDRLKAAVDRPETALVAATALAALKVDLCPLVRSRLKVSDPEGTALAARVLVVGGEAPAGSSCPGALSALIKSDAVTVPLRAQLLETLAVVSPSTVRHLALAALTDSDPRMRAA
ncbi:MAG TPA: TonB C-terminal domain-containing protein, partial [Polyangia bacterium]|nr:TonB C-terminal domain-containing protein [Polyangia bacterium]